MNGDKYSDGGRGGEGRTFQSFNAITACLLFAEPGRGRKRTKDGRRFPLLLCISIGRLISFRPFAISSAIRRPLRGREKKGVLPFPPIL